MRTIRRVAILGAGTMGSRIAAHFANAGVPARLLDLTLADAKRGVEVAAKQNPGAFFTPAKMSLITPGSFDDNLGDIADCDWVLEAVAENLEIKRSLWSRVDSVRNADAVLSTNTSGIPLAQICEGFSSDFRQTLRRNPLLQSTALSAPRRGDPRSRNRPGSVELCLSLL